MARYHYSAEERAFYNNYLRSPEWQARRRRALELAGGRCQFSLLAPGEDGVGPPCGSRDNLAVHHLSYARLGRELDEDLQVLCWRHHILEHLLWARCCQCRRPVLGFDSRAEIWLNFALQRRGFDPDNVVAAGRKLPTKEEFLAEMGDYCPECQH